jgi:hypothetical protein
MSHGVPQQRHGPCHGASATRPSTLLTLTTNCNQSAPRFPLFVTCFWSQATSERFSVLPPPRERPPPFPFTDFPLTPPSDTCCLLRGSDHLHAPKLFSPGASTSTCAAQRPASATSASAAATAAATTTTAEVSVGVGVARARADGAWRPAAAVSTSRLVVVVVSGQWSVVSGQWSVCVRSRRARDARVTRE